jgi:hypothetical protein
VTVTAAAVTAAVTAATDEIIPSSSLSLTLTLCKSPQGSPRSLGHICGIWHTHCLAPAACKVRVIRYRERVSDEGDRIEGKNVIRLKE